jgi:dipeptidyl-peptidase-4
VVYAIIDPMGSGFQGTDWLFSIYKNFGGPEVSSTIEVTTHLQNNLAYIDSKKTAIWGWSYGGFLSLSVLAHDADGVFKCAASVAPVVDWRLYDTYYTVRTFA